MGGTLSTDGTEVGTETRGFHVLKRRLDYSPSFDYIVAVNNMRIDDEGLALTRALQTTAEESVSMIVWNIKTRSPRELKVKPVEGSIGCNVRLCDYRDASSHVWHVTAVHENSPAQQAGLHPETDYILGVTGHTLDEKDSLLNLVETNIGNPLHFLVYSSVLDFVRELKLIPLRGWGGPGWILIVYQQQNAEKEKKSLPPPPREKPRDLPPPPQMGFVPRNQPLMKVVTKARSVLPNNLNVIQTAPIDHQHDHSHHSHEHSQSHDHGHGQQHHHELEPVAVVAAPVKLPPHGHDNDGKEHNHGSSDFHGGHQQDHGSNDNYHNHGERHRGNEHDQHTNIIVAMAMIIHPATIIMNILQLDTLIPRSTHHFSNNHSSPLPYLNLSVSPMVTEAMITVMTMRIS
ncbi:GRASP55/65 PDZ-like domain-containing protein [Chytridium lagenaria]|nr:GRASP55/65 PDZ-like domain-containing protein [Chytridium lagenaria]